jgi:hypothetical protein
MRPVGSVTANRMTLAGQVLVGIGFAATLAAVGLCVARVRFGRLEAMSRCVPCILGSTGTVALLVGGCSWRCTRTSQQSRLLQSTASAGTPVSAPSPTGGSALGAGLASPSAATPREQARMMSLDAPVAMVKAQLTEWTATTPAMNRDSTQEDEVARGRWTAYSAILSFMNDNPHCSPTDVTAQIEVLREGEYSASTPHMRTGHTQGLDQVLNLLGPSVAEEAS